MVLAFWPRLAFNAWPVKILDHQNTTETLLQLDQIQTAPPPHTIRIWPSSAEVARIGTSAFMQPPSFLNHRAGGENKAKLRQ